VLLILQYAKNCGFYRFHKEYLQMLKDAGVIVFRPSNWVDAVDEVVDSVECQIGSGEQRQALEDKQRKKALEEKMDNVIWKMNLIIVAVVCVVFGCLLGMLLTPKFGTGRILSCGPSLVKESVWKKEGFYRKIRQSSSRSAVDFRSARNLFALILWDCVMTWPEWKGRMDG
jgi:hypothetical protein